VVICGIALGCLHLPDLTGKYKGNPTKKVELRSKIPIMSKREILHEMEYNFA
jgi:hypothetical protein